ncbi:unnamed protein product [Cyclocybe aegerita]|uniref:Uncharacterized protein n=1 Tax=Cyclocybe aegerita TaxID=1973307 RepID=A0A8S0WCW4_CYCAE|nr:unnamed protein product [Cyclocybe aegerita]
MKAAMGGWIGSADCIPGRVWTVEELLEQGFKLERWDGREPCGILDDKNKLIIVLVGAPQDPSWEDAMRQVQEVFTVEPRAEAISSPFKLECLMGAVKWWDI